MTLEELIRDRATKGEMVHLSLFHEISSGLWCATYAPAHEFGNSIVRDQDPVKACEIAITAPKTKRSSNPAGLSKESRRTLTATVNEPITDHLAGGPRGPLEEEKAPDTLDNWLPRA